MIKSIAVSPKSVETPNFISTRYKHQINEFIVDGDYYLNKLDKRTGIRTKERVWNEPVPPSITIDIAGTPTLVNPYDPKYTWTKKPELYRPVVITWGENPPRIIDLITKEVIGYGMPLPTPLTQVASTGQLTLANVTTRGNAVVWSGQHEGKDEWVHFREQAAALLAQAGCDVRSLACPSSNELVPLLLTKNVWCHHAHGDCYGVVLLSTPQGDATESLEGSEVVRMFLIRGPYEFAFFGSCGAMDDVSRGTFAHAFTKNQVGHIAIGYRHLPDFPEVWQENGYSWEGKLFWYMVQGHKPVQAYELSIADIPEMALITACYEGTSPGPEPIGGIWGLAFLDAASGLVLVPTAEETPRVFILLGQAVILRVSGANHGYWTQNMQIIIKVTGPVGKTFTSDIFKVDPLNPFHFFTSSFVFDTIGTYSVEARLMAEAVP